MYPQTSKVSSQIVRIPRPNGQVFYDWSGRARIITPQGGISYNDRARAAGWAMSKLGAGYNTDFPWNRTFGPTFNCSQIVWAAWKATKGIDLDKDGGWGVYPADLRDSPRAKRVKWLSPNA